MTETIDDILDDPFHGAAWAAYIELASIACGHPDPEATRRLAYRYYEEALARKNERRQQAPASELTEYPTPDDVVIAALDLLTESQQAQQRENELERQIVRGRIAAADPTKLIPAKDVFDRLMTKAFTSS
ncbi:MAG TPA: hypothetical protein VGP68_06090 [Gemmataceae bacterium]|jgi:hypothetical protein|nr:hypothetical protein [Gemmataceae bacterium]